MEPNKNTGTKQAEIFLGILLVTLFGVAAVALAWKIVDYLHDEQTSLDYWKGLQDSVIIMDEGEQPQQNSDEEAEHGPPVTAEPEPPREDTPTEAPPEEDSPTEKPPATAEPKPEPTEEDTPTEAPVTEVMIPVAIDFDKLHAVSADAVAWIFAPDTKINYVIAQSDDNAYYLRRLLDGTSASGGSLFMDYRCAADFSDWNTMIYGHQMSNGTMFGELANYRDPGYYEGHPVMYLYVPGQRYKLELIAGYTTDIYDIVYSVPATKAAWVEILYRAIRDSSFDSGITVSGEDRLVTLSTCTYEFDNARYVVIGRLVED